MQFLTGLENGATLHSLRQNLLNDVIIIGYDLRNGYLPGLSTPVSSTAVSSTPISSTGVSSTQFFKSKIIISLI